MSILFIVPRASVWSPATGRGTQFLDAAAAYGREVGLDPGLPFESDEVTVDVRPSSVGSRTESSRAVLQRRPDRAGSAGRLHSVGLVEPRSVRPRR